jgi:hypothetical protein
MDKSRMIQLAGRGMTLTELRDTFPNPKPGDFLDAQHGGRSDANDHHAEVYQMAHAGSVWRGGWKGRDADERRATMRLVAGIGLSNPEYQAAFMEPDETFDQTAFRVGLAAENAIGQRRADEWPVRRFLDCSTGHLTHATQRVMNDLPWTVHALPFGWLCYIPEPESMNEAPPDLCAILEYARGIGCDYVMFDSDGHEFAQFPFFD